MTRVLVTGGSGFIGQHLVSALVAKGHRTRVLDIAQPNGALPDVEYIQGSVLDQSLVDKVMNGVDEVYHLAGLPGMWLPNKADFNAINYGGTEIVIAAAREHHVARFLHCSTESILFRSSPTDTVEHDECLAIEDMFGPYTRSKMRADQAAVQAAASGFPLVIACPTMPIGPHDHNLTPPTEMLRHFLKGGIQLYVDFIVNMVDVRDVAQGLILAMERGRAGHRYILGSESIPLKQVLELVAATSGRRHRLISIPARPAEILAGMLEFVSDHVTRRAPLGTAEGVRIAMRAAPLSNEKAQRELGYAPRSVQPALRETLAALLDAENRKLHDA